MCTAATTLALIWEARLPGRSAIFAAFRGLALRWRDRLLDGWRQPQAGVLADLAYQTFRDDLEVERERARWRRAAGLPAERGRFVRGEWRDRVQRLQSLSGEEKVRLGARMRGAATLEAEEGVSLEVFGALVAIPEDYEDDVRLAFARAFSEAMQKGADGAVAHLGLGADFTLRHPEAVSALEEYAGFYGDRITKLVGMEWQVAVKKAVVKGLDEGLSAAEMTAEIGRVCGLLSEHQAERIARTEAARARVVGSQQVYLAAGVQMLVWTVGPNPCPEICAPRAGKLFPAATIHQLQPAHPNCVCGAVASDADLDALRRQAFEGLGVELPALPAEPEPRYVQGMA